MLRIKDPKPTLDFYTKHFGMTLVDKKSFPDYKFDLYFLATLPDGMKVPEPGTKEANHFLWTFGGTVLELTHNYGTESDVDFKYANGNVEPHRGFGHIGFIVDSISSFCEGLETAGVRFQKRLTDGRMKDIAFCLDPDGYWIELLSRTADSAGLPAQPDVNVWPTVSGKPSLQQVMVRIRDPALSLPFYEKHFGMTLVCRRDFPEAKFSVYFLGTLPPGCAPPTDVAGPDAWAWLAASSGCFLELTHNHGTEDPASGFAGYHNGNSEPGRGYGHIGFLTDELEASCGALEAAGVSFTKRPQEGKMRGLAFARDPDGYLIEIVQRGLDM
jgi:lactoylglutathione lyase